jgi:ACS family pantothenate transporter-like MFS transporter
MFLGILQAALYRNMNGVHGLSGWMWLFIIAGSITIGQGLLAFITIPDSPAITRAIWLSQDERQLARDRMDSFGATTSRIVPISVLKTKLRQLIVHPVTYLVMISFALSAWSSRANSYFVLYLESIKDGAGNRKYSTYEVNILPLGGYALQIATSIAFNWLSDYKHWRWQIAVGSSIASAIVLAVLSCWPSSDKTILTFYFLTYATNAGNPSLMAWLAELLRAEPEARAIIVAMTVTLVYVGHATIPLGAWRVADAPRYPIGFPMATVMSAATVFTLLTLLWGLRRGVMVELACGRRLVTMMRGGRMWKSGREGRESLVPRKLLRRGVGVIDRCISQWFCRLSQRRACWVSPSKVRNAQEIRTIRKPSFNGIAVLTSCIQVHRVLPHRQI